MVSRVQTDLEMLQKWNREEDGGADGGVFLIPPRSYALRDLVSFPATVQTKKGRSSPINENETPFPLQPNTFF